MRGNTAAHRQSENSHKFGGGSDDDDSGLRGCRSTRDMQQSSVRVAVDHAIRSMMATGFCGPYYLHYRHFKAPSACPDMV
ncbi:hypothetical protein GGTG_10778 [Gaeumannomyces tritici R3-111a-1]|uniref:Uncharacterized protein n=1 Tax=Gaeumannomyces tritici (strain R3-111a-1) TaxID=644352 RepID=J3PBA5_GAET3|nr:hypothetical protein GGTG_10778 [Gaeumannomyces tritici R3-111a-1]EJT71521.1 hypothetical protein GGTG_10778 [Gaeumannomyces tritici R3-111a-1]